MMRATRIMRGYIVVDRFPMTTRKRHRFCRGRHAAWRSVCRLPALLAADLYFHHRVERFAGVNIWGYRGPRVSRKKAPGEHRLVVIGGSTAFGYGVDWDQAFPAYLERDLRAAVDATARRSRW